MLGPALSGLLARIRTWRAAAPAGGPDLGPGAPGSPPEAGTIAAPSAAGPEQEATRCEAASHKHNLKHRYELQETLGKGTYGKVKRATERFFGPSGELGGNPAGSV